MEYQLAKELEDSGFPMYEDAVGTWRRKLDSKEIGLSELIEACVNDEIGFECVYFRPRENSWVAHAFGGKSGTGFSPEEAVMRLWLAVNSKK